MASVPSRYIYYGGVEGVHQATASDLNGAEYGAAAFGFAEGAPITGELVFSGEAYELLAASGPLNETAIPADAEGLEIFLQMPRMGPPLFGLTEAQLASANVLIALPSDPDDPLPQLSFKMVQNEDGATVTVGDIYTHFSDDDDAMAEAYGVWLPEHVEVDIRVGGAGGDTLRGGEDWNFLYGLGGHDKLIIREGENGWAWGGEGNDTLKGADDADHLFGGWGNDRIDGGEGQDLIKGGLGADVISAGRDDDVVFGGAGDDSILGGDGGDYLEGNGGGDTVNGGSGEDFLDGRQGDDSLEGGGGDDVIFGGAGNDTLRGGAGADDFHFEDFHGSDRIMGFQLSADQIHLAVSDPLDFETLMDTAVYAGGNTTLTYFQGATITLVGIAPGQLNESNFVFA